MVAGFYCKQKGHCGKGMTFSINPTEEKSQAKFKQMAIDQNGAVGGLYGANGASATVPPYVAVLAAGTGVAAPPGTAPAASGALPTPSGNATVYSAPLQPPPQQNNGIPPPPQQNNGIPPPPQQNNGTPPPPAATQQPGVIQGTGETVSSQCSCSCFCGVSAFPEGAGLGMWGGMPG